MSRTLQMERPLEILIVEDNPGDVRLTSEAFKECGITNHMIVVGDGAEAMEYLKRTGRYADAGRPDIVLLDLNLPKMNGIEFLEYVKSDRELKEIPIIVLTSSHAQSDVADCYSRHANCYITKPADLDAFIRTVQSIEDFWFHLVTLPAEEGRRNRVS